MKKLNYGEGKQPHMSALIGSSSTIEKKSHNGSFLPAALCGGWM